MILFGCNKCLTLVRLVDDPTVVHRLVRDHPKFAGGHWCVRCGEPVQLVRHVDFEAWQNLRGTELVKFLELNAAEYFRAACGFGLPDEISTEPEVVKSLLLSSRVIEAKVQKSISGRTILSRLDLDNGLSLHLAMSSNGPTVFKITRKQDGPEVADDLGVVCQDPNANAVLGADIGGPGGDAGRTDDREVTGDGDLGRDHYGRSGGEHPQASPEVSGCKGDDVPATHSSYDVTHTAEGVRIGSELHKHSAD